MASKYNQEQKDEVIAFIQKYNEENGRGGQSAAVSKWNLNPVTVKAWLKKAGVATPGRGGRKKKAAADVTKSGRKPGRPKVGRPAGKAGKPGRKPGRKAGRKPGRAAAGGGDLQGTLNRLVAVQEQIAQLEKEAAKIKAELKAKL